MTEPAEPAVQPSPESVETIAIPECLYEIAIRVCDRYGLSRRRSQAVPASDISQA